MKKIYWTDFHSNLNRKKLKDIQSWYDQAKEMLDFWAPVYYPFTVGVGPRLNFLYEDELKPKKYLADWEDMRAFCDQLPDDFPVYMAFEWQGTGADGDHNVFFRDNTYPMEMPRTYQELLATYGSEDVIAIPHHIGYESGHRGKNWDTHDEAFSPVAEIYSSHGCSEASDSDIPMNVHIHMGPRTERGTYRAALKRGIKVGAMASGDNHCCSAISGNGFMAVIADGCDKDALFDAIKGRHTYAVSRNRIELDYRINDAIMGSEIKGEKTNRMTLDVVGGNAVDRVELYKNGEIQKVYVHSGSYEKAKLTGEVTFKFELELGWGPDTRIFRKMKEKTWDVELTTDGEIVGVERLWTSGGCEITEQTHKKVCAKVTSRKAKGGKLSQKNQATPYLQNQSMIFEIRGSIDSSIVLVIDGERHVIPIESLLVEAQVIVQERQVREMLEERCGFTDFFREDAFYRNAHKALLHRAAPEAAYRLHIEDALDEPERAVDSYYVKVIQKNGAVAWSSPIWIENEEVENETV